MMTPTTASGACVRVEALDGAQRLEPVHPGHLDVQGDHVGRSQRERLQGLLPAEDRAHDLDPFLARQGRLHGGAEESASHRRSTPERAAAWSCPRKMSPGLSGDGYAFNFNGIAIRKQVFARRPDLLVRRGHGVATRCKSCAGVSTSMGL